MAATPILPLIILFCVSQFPLSFCQWTSPQNIETRYPFSPSPEIIPPPEPSSPPVRNDVPEMPVPGFPGPPPPRKNSTGAAVGRAIGVTAASTVVLSALLFFLLLRRSRRKRERENDTVTQGGTAGPVTRPQIDNFRRFNGNVKGIIVDENGLDVLYWRNLQDEEARWSFKKKNYRSLKEEQRQEIKRIESGKDRKKKPPVQESPLLRGMSSSSESPIWGIRDEKRPVIEKAPSIPPPTAVTVGIMQESSFKGKQLALEVPPPPIPAMKPVTPPLPPPPAAFVAAPVRKEVVPSPPPPPPMAIEAVRARKAVAPPPPPPMSIEAVPARKAAAPPPPPPIPKNKASPAPPPPAKPSSNPIGEGPSTSNNSSSEQVKLKPLHWDKVNANVQHSMVWDKIDKGSFRFDGDLMEALFGYVATNRKSPQRDGRSSIPGQGIPQPPAQIFILDTRKSQNTAIVLKSLGVARQEIMDALIDGDGLSSDALEKLVRIAPTDEEISQILAFNGHPSKLAEAESFLYYLLKAVPLAFNRFHAMLFRLNYDVEASIIKDSLQSLVLACKELRTRGLFLKLLEAVLKAGNRLNAGTARGNAQAFNLTALTKLSDVKSSDGKTTLLQFVVQEVVRAEGKRCVVNKNRNLSRTSSHSSNGMNQSVEPNSNEDAENEYMILGLPVIGGLSAEFSNVKKAASLDYDQLVKTTPSLAAQLTKIRAMVEQCGPEGGFVYEMTGFLDTAESEMRGLKEEQTKVMELVKKTTDYYQAGSSKGTTNSFQLFIIVRDFLQMVDQVCVEIARNVQKRKHGSSSTSSGSGTPSRIFKFPKLPANFMSDDSRSSLEDDDSEGR